MKDESIRILLNDEINDLVNSAGVNGSMFFDALDTAITIDMAMGRQQCDDLREMISVLGNDPDYDPSMILCSVLHDTGGYKSQYHKEPGSDCWIAHSDGYCSKRLESAGNKLALLIDQEKVRARLEVLEQVEVYIKEKKRLFGTNGYGKSDRVRGIIEILMNVGYILDGKI